jgi:hypothetical protein
MNYIYICLDCEQKAIQAGINEQSPEYPASVLYETSHPMMPTEADLKSAVICPRCLSPRGEKSFFEYNIQCYIRGNGFLDKAGTKRDMNIHTITKNDPFAEHRVPGEVDQVVSDLRKADKHDPKPMHFVV